MGIGLALLIAGADALALSGSFGCTVSKLGLSGTVLLMVADGSRAPLLDLLYRPKRSIHSCTL